MTEEKQTTYRIGPIRPPSEANSLLLQITEGCTWNRCKFCGLYKHEGFRAFSVESIKKDIDVMAEYARIARDSQREDGSWDKRAALEKVNQMTREEQNCYYLVYRWLAHGGENVFLQDGNSLAVKTERVAEVLRYLKEKLPGIKRITTYGRAETLSKISVEQYLELKSAGLNRIHSGFESGSDRVLALINKGVTSEQEIIAGKNIKEAGVELSVYFMPGIGGKALSAENAPETARVVRAINPDFVRIRTAVVKEGTELWQDYLDGIFQLCSENEKLAEIRLLIEHTGNCTGFLASDHIINLLQEVEGRLDRDHGKMLSMIDRYFSMTEYEQKLYQLARRSGMVKQPEDLAFLPSNYIERFAQITGSVSDEALWDRKMNDMMANFI
ncbi:MAG TPA: radical SAM protein [Anaerovoracaceae bacterium]|nr:radical SAM protein [Anaerovoracaceae bacterium]